ncbi:MAG: DUF2577 domain-containing protein [Firmicutes bacterium]|nr:DUF2577 domain-containing protein [Bacillota bacterium]
MKKDPCIKLLETIRAEGSKYNPPEIRLARVLSPLPSLQISIGDLVLNSDDLYLSTSLMEREFEATFIGDIKGRMDEEEKEIKESMMIGQISLKSTLSIGDLLVVYPFNNSQKYIVIGKVVSL